MKTFLENSLTVPFVTNSVFTLFRQIPPIQFSLDQTQKEKGVLKCEKKLNRSGKLKGSGCTLQSQVLLLKNITNFTTLS